MTTPVAALSGHAFWTIALVIGLVAALIVVLVFQFAYLVLLASEARFARRIDRCDFAVADKNVEAAVDSGSGIDQAAAFE